MSIRKLVPAFSSFYFKIYIVVLIISMMTTFSQVDSTDSDADNQLVALEEDENDFNNLNQVSSEYERIDRNAICHVPKYAPYLTILRVTRTEIEFNITDINDKSQVDGFLIYYWGFRLGPKSSYRSEDRHFGTKNFTVTENFGPFVISNLQPKFSYCADLVSYNKCGHSPFCMGCFEAILTL